MKFSRHTKALAKNIVENCTEYGRCMPNCPFLQAYCQSPKQLFQKFLDDGDIDPEIPYSCLLCSHCTRVCPQQLKLDEAFYSMRKDLIKNSRKRPLKSLKGVYFHQRFSYCSLFTTVNKGHAQPKKAANKEESAK